MISNKTEIDAIIQFPHQYFIPLDEEVPREPIRNFN